MTAYYSMCATATGIPSLVIGGSCAIKLTVCLMGKFVFNYRPQRSWGKVMFLQASVILLMGRGCLLRRVSAPGVSAPGGCVSAPGGCLLPGSVCSKGGVCSGGCLLGGGLVETPRDGYCCGRYASYWNAFLFVINFSDPHLHCQVYRINVRYTSWVPLKRVRLERATSYNPIWTPVIKS